MRKKQANIPCGAVAWSNRNRVRSTWTSAAVRFCKKESTLFYKPRIGAWFARCAQHSLTGQGDRVQNITREEFIVFEVMNS